MDNDIQNRRIASIDRLRGFIIFCMVFFQLFERFENLGWIARLASHDEVKGIHLIPGLDLFVLADIFAPLFFFVIAMNYIPSFRRRIARDGRKAAYLHFVTRYLSILGVGCCMKMIEEFSEGSTGNKTEDNVILICFIGVCICVALGIALLITSFIKKASAVSEKIKKILFCGLSLLGIANLIISTYNLYLVFWRGYSFSCWGVLQSIGTAGLIAILFAEAGTVVRAFASAGLFGIFTFIHNLPVAVEGEFKNAMEGIDGDVQGGVLGAIGWCSMLLAFTVAADLFYRDRAKKQEGKKGISANTYLIATAVFVILGVLGANMTVNKGSVSPGYILLNLPVCAVIFYLFSLTDGISFKIQPLTWWGVSPIIMYLFQWIFHDVIYTVCGLENASNVVAVIFVIGSTAIITAAAYLLYKNKKTLKV